MRVVKGPFDANVIKKSYNLEIRRGDTTLLTYRVVLGKDAACKGGPKVVDIPKDATPKLPPTWPGVPLLIDSPAYDTAISANTADVHVPLAALGNASELAFDGVTAGLRINANLHAPLLCVENVFKVASGDLSLPGKITP